MLLLSRMQCDDWRSNKLINQSSFISKLRSYYTIYIERHCFNVNPSEANPCLSLFAVLWVEARLGLGNTAALRLNQPNIGNNRGLWHQKQVSQAGIINCIPQYSVGCNYLFLPEIPASDTKVLNHLTGFDRTLPSKYYGSWWTKSPQLLFIYDIHYSLQPHKARTRFNIKTPSYQNRNVHYIDKTVSLSSPIYNGNPFISKTTSWYWNGTLAAVIFKNWESLCYWMTAN